MDTRREAHRNEWVLGYGLNKASEDPIRCDPENDSRRCAQMCEYILDISSVTRASGCKSAHVGGCIIKQQLMCRFHPNCRQSLNTSQ